MKKLYSTVREVRAYADSLRAQGISGQELQDKVVRYVWDNDHTILGNLQNNFHSKDKTAVPVVTDEGYPALDIYIEEGWHFIERIEIPVTRGFSDSGKRVDTNMSDLDITCALNEIMRERKGKLTPHELQTIVPLSDLGMDKQEFEDLCEAVCQV